MFTLTKCVGDNIIAYGFWPINTALGPQNIAPKRRGAYIVLNGIRMPVQCSCYIVWDYLIGMPLLIRCHCQRAGRPCQLLATLHGLLLREIFPRKRAVFWKFLPWYESWGPAAGADLLFQWEDWMLPKMVRFRVLFLLYKTCFQQYCTPVPYIRLMTNLQSCALHRNQTCSIAFKEIKTKVWMIKVIFTFDGRFEWLIVVSFQQVQILRQCII